MIAAAEAGYLEDDNIVFAVSLDGDARAYPRRILAWHEMFKDSIAGEHYTGVYCTLCGSMILYRSAVRGEHHELGTSGFLYVPTSSCTIMPPGRSGRPSRANRRSAPSSAGASSWRRAMW